ncbi:MAG: DUF4293 domain-containing protein [Chitinophagales bacterium]|nr:DUF4293 domain-containing protein [Chitinophagales bacterium]
MIQRQQTLWLLLATLCAIFSFQFPFLTGSKLINNQSVAEDLDAASNFFLLIMTGASVILSVITIFMFKDRKLQIQLCLLGIVLSIGILAVYIVQMQKFEKSTLALYCILPFVVLISYFMAFRGVRKDEKLVKSLDKLR